MKRKLFAILPMIGVALLAMFSIEAHAAAAHVASLMPDITAEGITQALAGAGALGVAGSTVASHVEKHASSKWFRIMTEGPTVDGRTIDRAWIEQMAATYDPKVYGARINLEHFAGIDPNGLFKAYGDVTALRSEEVDGKLALFAQVAPTQDLVDLVKKGQKIYTSGEVHPNFTNSKQAYLIGLAVTDRPASIGTEALSFNARNTNNLFSAALEATIEFEEPQVSIADQVKKVFSTVTALLGKKEATDGERFTDVHQAVVLLATNAKEQAEALAQLSTDNAKLAKDYAELRTQHDKVAADFASLQTKLSTTQADPARPHNTGNSGAVRTDC